MLRAATPADLEAMRTWRNHPQVRAVSLTTHEIGPEEHAAWWERAQADPARVVLVYGRSGVASGVVVFTLGDPADGSATWGFYLDLEGLGQRGETLPAWTQIGREAVGHAFDVLGVTELHGEVLGTNESVRRMNRLWHFTESGPRVVDVDGRPTEVYDIVLRADQRRAPRL